MTFRQTEISPKNAGILLSSVFVVAACGLVYELTAGAVSSYILGDAVTQFSLVIGIFLCAMGLGSFLAKYINRNLLKAFVEIEIWIGLIGGVSSLIMFATSAFVEEIFPVFFYSLCVLIGVLIGLEIPLLIRILKKSKSISESLSHVMALDYLGALVGAIAFPLLVLPYLGLSRASVVFGIMNLGVAAIGLKLLAGNRTWISLRLMAASCILITALFYSARMVGYLEDLLYQDSIIFAKTTPYQRIVLTRWRDDIRLYLNGNIQFCSIDEARYHEALVIPAMEASSNPRNVLILGGGDGMAAREVLKYKQVESIILVDIDPVMTELSRRRPEMVSLNEGALNSFKVKVVNQDAMKFLVNDSAFYDVIIIDLPDPSTETLSKLYSKSFYALCTRRLTGDGFLVTQATSPFFAPDAFWCIARTIEESGSSYADLPGIHSLPFHVNVPSFGEWGFVLAGKRRLDHRQLALSVYTRYLTTDTLHAMFSFGRDMQPNGNIEINRLDHPILQEYYKLGWRMFNE